MTDALLALARVAEPAGVPPAVARAEGAALAAAVAESAPRAHTDWVVAVADAGGDARTTQDFFDAARQLALSGRSNSPEATAAASRMVTACGVSL